MEMADTENPRVQLLASMLLEASGARAVTIVFDGAPGELEDALIARNSVLAITRPAKLAVDSDEPFPKPSADAAADRAGGTVARPSVAAHTSGWGRGETLADLEAAALNHRGLLEPAELVTGQSMIGEIAEELAVIAKTKGIFSSVSIHITLDGRQEVAQPPEDA
jgi:hypothetical protein